MFFFLHYGNTLDASKGKKKFSLSMIFLFFLGKKILKLRVHSGVH